jgi:hypothetical protein
MARVGYAWKTVWVSGSLGAAAAAGCRSAGGSAKALVVVDGYGACRAVLSLRVSIAYNDFNGVSTAQRTCRRVSIFLASIARNANDHLK